MAECICTELLWKAYEELNEKIRGKYGLFVEKMLFPGSELPLEAMEGMFSQIGQTTVSFNRFYVLSPKKSVVYQARLGDTACTELCSSCGNKDCPTGRQRYVKRKGRRRDEAGKRTDSFIYGRGKGKNHRSHGTGPACGRIGEKGADCAVHEGAGIRGSFTAWPVSLKSGFCAVKRISDFFPL